MKTRSAMLAAATAAIALVASSGPAVAGEASNAQVEVSYRDLDLSTPAGAKALDQRLHRAAKEVCGMTSTTTGTRLPSSEARACYKETLGQLQERFAHLMPTDKERG